MKGFIGLLYERCKKGIPSMLVTIVANRGSTPRSAGAYMVVGEEGRIHGTIGGGMLEYKATQVAVEKLQNQLGGLQEYKLSPQETAGLGMVCGGDVDVLYTYLPPTGANEEVLLQLCERQRNHIESWLSLSMDGSRIGSRIRLDGMPLGRVVEGEETYFVMKISEESKVYLFGGGHLTEELVPILYHLNFRCIVIDDRTEFATKERFPEAEEVRVCEYAKMEGEYVIQPQDYIIVMTRGHLGDYEVQKYALTTSAFYIGAIGSRKKIEYVNKKLAACGFSKERIQRIISPIGLDIDSETPAEIAISIAAQLIQKRAEYTKCNQS